MAHSRGTFTGNHYSANFIHFRRSAGITFPLVSFEIMIIITNFYIRLSHNHLKLIYIFGLHGFQVVFVWIVIAIMLAFMCSTRAREAAIWSQRRWATGSGPSLPLWEQGGHSVRVFSNFARLNFERWSYDTSNRQFPFLLPLSRTTGASEAHGGRVGDRADRPRASEVRKSSSHRLTSYSSLSIPHC